MPYRAVFSTALMTGCAVESMEHAVRESTSLRDEGTCTSSCSTKRQLNDGCDLASSRRHRVRPTNSSAIILCKDVPRRGVELLDRFDDREYRGKSETLLTGMTRSAA